MINKLLIASRRHLNTRALRVSPRISSGFTLIETMLAIALLTTAIAGPLTIASKGLSTSLLAKDQIGAFNLAQDGMEFIRFARDTNKLSGGDWLAGTSGGANVINLSSCVSTGGTASCYVDSIQSTVTVCGTTCPVINYDSTNHYYSYSTGSPSQQHYVRTIQIITPVGSNSHEAAVLVKVAWTAAGGLSHSLTLREDIFDWQ